MYALSSNSEDVETKKKYFFLIIKPFYLLLFFTLHFVSRQATFFVASSSSDSILSDFFVFSCIIVITWNKISWSCTRRISLISVEEQIKGRTTKILYLFSFDILKNDDYLNFENFIIRVILKPTLNLNIIRSTTLK